MKNKKRDLELNRIISSLAGRRWVKRGHWHQSVLSNELYRPGESTKFQERLGYPFIKTTQISFNGDWFDLEDEWSLARRTIKSELTKDKNFIDKYAADCLYRGENLVVKCEKYTKINPSLLSNTDLAETYKNFVEGCWEYMPFMFTLHLFDEFLENKFNSQLREYLKKTGESEKLIEYQIALSYPSRKIFVLKEINDLEKIAILIQSGATESDIKTKLINHAKKYGWFGLGNFESAPYTVDYYSDRLMEILKNDVIKLHEQKIAEEKRLLIQRDLLEKSIKDKALLYTAKIVQDFGFLRSYRIDVTRIAFSKGWHIFSEISKRLGLQNTIDLTYLSIDEIHSALRNEINYTKLIQERKQGMLSITVDDKSYHLSGDIINKILSKLNLPITEKQVAENQVKGVVAFPGKISGSCVVLRSAKEMYKVKTGDILIVSMTDPNYLPAMEKAAAFVTDQGGILCHAAIVSREMKKPCIIGTKNATQVFKTGNLIEVNTDQGIVRKI